MYRDHPADPPSRLAIITTTRSPVSPLGGKSVRALWTDFVTAIKARNALRCLAFLLIAQTTNTGPAWAKAACGLNTQSRYTIILDAICVPTAADCADLGGQSTDRSQKRTWLNACTHECTTTGDLKCCIKGEECKPNATVPTVTTSINLGKGVAPCIGNVAKPIACEIDLVSDCACQCL